MCVSGILHSVRQRLLSLFASSSSLPEVEPLTKEEKKKLVDKWPEVKEKHPDLFLKTWIKSARMSVNIKKATGVRDDEDPATNARFVSLSPFLEAFVDKLIIEFRCNDAKVAESSRKLGARHTLIENFHTNFWDIFLGNLIQIMIETHPEREQCEIVPILEKFFSFFVSFMHDGYRKRIQENLSGQRRMMT